ncbi:MAG: RagB/SusD family nutrient uptake outer membrane protein [Prevotella sp.]|jgi:hypothetical protein
MKTLRYIAVGCLMTGAAVLTSCGSDYLDTKPTESVSTQDAIGTAENAYKALNGIARTMSCQQYMGSQGECGENRIMSLYENYMSQDYYYNAFSSGWAVLMNLKYTQSNYYCQYPWYYYYNIIGQANSIIANIDAATGDEDLKNFDKAAALTFRAYGYEKLIHYYAPRWQDSNNGASEVIVLRTDESTGDKAPSSLTEVYAQIYQDCEDAISLFESSSYSRPSGEVWIPNENVAHAVYARAALWRQDYETALTQATAARSGYPLMSNADYQAGFCKPTSEWIFGSYGDATENNWYWSYGTQFSADGYYANNTWYGAGQISDALTQQIPNTDVRKHLFLTPDKIGWDSSAVYLTSDSATAYNMAVAYMDSIHAAYTSGYNEYYAGSKAAGVFWMGSQWKFCVFDMPGVGYLPFIRSSEMLLIEAEANYFLGNTSEAQANLVELNATSGRDPEYTCTKTGSDLFDEIVKYRTLELWGEGFGFSDYKRWNLPIDRTNSDNCTSSIKVRVETTSTGWSWKIPLSETDYNNAYYGTQNDSVQ